MINLGATVKEKLSGIVGVAGARTQYMTGCDRIGVARPGVDDKGKTHDWLWFDEGMLDIVPDVPVISPNVLTVESTVVKGGPQPEAPSR